ncbi:MAG: H-type lectin domain-containing protein [Bryobacteraceae bacterium]
MAWRAAAFSACINRRSSRLRIEVKDVSTRSAIIQISCWDVCRIWGCRVRWLAIGE